jgi:hypothetical protein
VSVNISKSEYCSIAKRRLLGKIPSTALSIDTFSESTPNAKVLSATVIVSFTFSRVLAIASWNIDDGSTRLTCRVVSRNLWTSGIALGT